MAEPPKEASLAIRPDLFPIIGSPLTPASSISINSVWLLDWWLVKVKGEGLAVAGTASIGRSRERRMFHSAPISKRPSATRLETIDGINVTISSVINESRTLQSGFSFSVCQHFKCGFPDDWEKYSYCYACEEAVRRGLAPTKSSLNEINSFPDDNECGFLLDSLDNLSAIEIHNHILELSEESAHHLLHDILRELRENVSQHTPVEANLRMEEDIEHRAPSNDKKAKAQQMLGCGGIILDGRFEDSELYQSQSKRVTTRSRLRSLRSIKNENVVLHSCMISNNFIEPPGKILSPESEKGDYQCSKAEMENYNGRVVNQSASQDIAAVKQCTQNKVVPEPSRMASVRRSGRLKRKMNYAGM